MNLYTCLQPKWQRHPIIEHYTVMNGMKFKSTKYRVQSSYFRHKEKSTLPLSTRASFDEAKDNASGLVPLREEHVELKVDEIKGSIAGAVALITGTSIGTGILAVPKKAFPAGLFPSSMSLLVCWAFLLIEALVLVEINIWLMKKKGKRGGDAPPELEVVSIRTMAQETLGDVGGNLATVTYVFMGYSSMVAYGSKSGEILSRLLDIPAPVSGFVFVSLFTMLVSVGGTRMTDQVNQLLTVVMIGLLVGIEIIVVVFGRWSGNEGIGDWGKVPSTLPVMIFSLVYHDVVPVLCAYMGSDIKRLRISVFLGSLVPLVTLLIWDGIAFGLSASTDRIPDPVELLMSAEWSGVPFMVEAFSILAVGTSMIGTLLGFVEFFKEQLANASWGSAVSKPALHGNGIYFVMREWWGRHKINLVATTVAVAPSLLVSSTVPDVFFAATDFAGGYCMAMLFGVLPPAMALALHSKQPEDSEKTALSSARPVLVGVGLFACGIVAEQILIDILSLGPS